MFQHHEKAPMTYFRGFPDGKVHFTRMPVQFFSDLLPQIDHIGELKITLYTFWFIEQQDGDVRYITKEDFIQDKLFFNGLGKKKKDAETVLDDGLERAITRGTLLEVMSPDTSKTLYFINTPRGRAAVQALRKGERILEGIHHPKTSLDLQRPNIYQLYEDNIGPLTPMIAEDLDEVEKTYSMEWIEEAIRIAVRNNVRRWRYVEAILRSWLEEGRDDKDRRDTTQNRRRYVEGELSDFIEH